MSRKFTIKVAGAEWLESGYGFWWLACPGGTIGRVTKMRDGKYEASTGEDTKLCPSLRAAKAYVIKQLSGEKSK